MNKIIVLSLLFLGIKQIYCAEKYNECISNLISKKDVTKNDIKTVRFKKTNEFKQGEIVLARIGMTLKYGCYQSVIAEYPSHTTPMLQLAYIQKYNTTLTVHSIIIINSDTNEPEIINLDTMKIGKISQ
ncbi:hypothetical protein KG892_05040 [Vermiphilus pyriformis]|jgi:hypothetical protein|nr:MAG: hypothetical protein KG892_05040 [Vermiphilus pyriformis]